MRTYGELKLDVGKLIQRSSSSTFLDKIGIWLQMSHNLLADIYDFYAELQGIHNFSSIASQEDYPLPNKFDKPFRLYDLTNDKKISFKLTEEGYFDGNIANIANATEGTPDKARIYGITGTRVALSSTGTTVKAKSSKAESPARTIRIRGFVDSDKLIEESEDIAVSGTTFAANSSPKTFYEITHWAKSANSIGYITLANSTGTTLDTLSPTERVARHFILKLGLIPNATLSYRLLYKKIISQMVDDNDYPFTESDRYLTLDAYGWALKQDGQDAKATFTWQKAEEALRIILNKQSSRLGPEYQHKAINQWIQSHRV